MNAVASTPLLREGHNCWRIERSHRVAVIVDAAAYFEAAAAAMERARRSILLVGWDLHSRIRLRRGEPQAGEQTLTELLEALVARERRLHIRLLLWDFAMLFALEREALPRLRLGYATHRRVHFRLDGDHPLGASHHQKILVVDDALAFVGGIDLTACRWDTPEHRIGDPRRNDPGFPDFQPFHDVQVAVDGPAAAALGELARERWRLATGQRLKATPSPSDPWPADLRPAFRDVEIGIARTLPAHEGRPEVREVEHLYADALRAAQRSVYIENQYLSSDRIGSLLEELLAREQGPEIVILLPWEGSGWLEERTMGVLRRRIIRRLRRADRAGRLAIYHPVLPGGKERLHVHAKVLVIDDTHLRVGSANLSNRSMGFDTECDVAIEAQGRSEVAAAIADFRNRLLAEHLGADRARVAEVVRERGSLRGAIAALGGGQRTLEPLRDEPEEQPEVVLAASALADPERPIGPEDFIRRFLPEDGDARADGSGRRGRLKLGSGLLALAALAILWRWTPLAELASVERLSALAEPLQESPWGPVVAVAVFTLAGMLMVPVVALIVATGLVFGGALGFWTALAGALATAATGYAVGALLWRDGVRRLMGRRANALSRRLAARGILSIAALRVVPVAPFTVVNLAAGASHIRWRDYLLGTLVGMGPGVLGLTLIAERVVALVRSPKLSDVVWVMVLVTLLAAAVAAARRWLAGATRTEGEASRPADERA